MPAIIDLVKGERVIVVDHLSEYYNRKGLVRKYIGDNLYSIQFKMEGQGETSVVPLSVPFERRQLARWKDGRARP